MNQVRLKKHPRTLFILTSSSKSKLICFIAILSILIGPAFTSESAMIINSETYAEEIISWEDGLMPRKPHELNPHNISDIANRDSYRERKSRYSGNSPRVSKSKLQLGTYLLPAKEKVALSDWTHPSIDDYKTIQNYLAYAKRPELKYLNEQGSVWREKRIRNFKVITETENPEFHIIFFNSDSQDKKNCIVTYISFNETYRNSLNDLIRELHAVGFNGHLIYHIGGWPNTEDNSLELFDVPYAFKIFSILEAQKLGYKNCLWLDACFYPLKPLDPIFEQIATNGVFLHLMPLGYTTKEHIHEFTTLALGGITVAEFLKLTPVNTNVIGLDLTNSMAKQLLTRWLAMAKTKIGFLSYIPEMAPWYILAKEFNLYPYADHSFIAQYKETITDESLLFWNHVEPNP